MSEGAIHLISNIRAMLIQVDNNCQPVPVPLHCTTGAVALPAAAASRLLLTAVRA
jgi:hypothetical protein